MSAAPSPEVFELESRDEMPAPGAALRFRRTSGSGVAQSVRGVRGGVFQKLRGFERRAEESELSPMALRLQKAEQPADNDSAGKIVLYTTSMKAIRGTHAECIKVTRLFGALRVKFDIKDVLLHPDFMGELQERVGDPDITVPQVFINGEHVGDAEMIMDMNETGELSAMLKVFQREYVADCSECGGKRFVACRLCQGSKKGKRSAFGTLRCTQCNQHGLQACPACSGGPGGTEGGDGDVAASAAGAAAAAADDDDDVAVVGEQPRRRAMTAPSRAKPGRLDVSGFERAGRCAEDAEGGGGGGGGAARRQVRPLAASRLTRAQAGDSGSPPRVAVRRSEPALQLADGEVRERMRTFEETTAPEEPLPTAAHSPVPASAESPSPSSPSPSSSSAQDGGSAASPAESFARQTREQRIQFALRLARSTDADAAEAAAGAAGAGAEDGDDPASRPSHLADGGNAIRPRSAGDDGGTAETRRHDDRASAAASAGGDGPTDGGTVSVDGDGDAEDDGASFI